MSFNVLNSNVELFHPHAFTFRGREQVMCLHTILQLYEYKTLLRHYSLLFAFLIVNINVDHKTYLSIEYCAQPFLIRCHFLAELGSKISDE